MPPVFICETDDDRTTLSENSVGFYMAARKAGVSAELHIFRTGGHGYGCGDDLHRLVSGKYFLQSGLRVLEFLVKMDIVYEDKDKIILNKSAGQPSQSGKSFEMDLVSKVLTYRKARVKKLTQL